MCAATPPVLTVTMPWELPGISLVIGEDEPIVPTPILYPVPVVDEEVSHSNPSHRVARVEHIRGSYHEVIDFKLTLDESEITASRWNRALEKWCLIFARGRSCWPRGHDIDTLVAQKGVAGLRSQPQHSFVLFIGSPRHPSVSHPSHCKPMTWKVIWSFYRISQHLRQHCLASLRQSISARRF